MHTYVKFCTNITYEIHMRNGVPFANVYFILSQFCIKFLQYQIFSLVKVIMWMVELLLMFIFFFHFSGKKINRNRKLKQLTLCNVRVGKAFLDPTIYPCFVQFKLSFVCQFCTAKKQRNYSMFVWFCADLQKKPFSDDCSNTI